MVCRNDRVTLVGKIWLVGNIWAPCALASTSLLLAVCLTVAVPGGVALAQTSGDAGAVSGRVTREDRGHGQSGMPDLESRDFSDEQLLRIRKLEERVTCACPRENWSKTLAHCPDRCANPQKEEIRTEILQGKSNSEILQAQAQRYGPKALAQPGRSLKLA